MLLKLFYLATDVIPRYEYTATDSQVFRLLDSEWVEIVHKIRVAQRDAEAMGLTGDDFAAKINEIIDPFLTEFVHRPSVERYNLTRFFTSHTGKAKRTTKQKERGLFEVVGCESCGLFPDDSLTRCPYCGTPTKTGANTCHV